MMKQPLVTVLWDGNGSEDGFHDLQLQTLAYLELITSQAFCGKADERVKTAAQPQGKYVLYARPPCRFAAAALETMVAAMEDAGAGVCVCGQLVKDEKRSALSCDAVSDAQKLALSLRLMERGLFMTPNNTLLCRGDARCIEEEFLRQAKESPIVMRSAALVTLPNAPKNPDAQYGVALLRHFLEQEVRRV